MARTVILPLAAGALLSLGCGLRDAAPASSPASELPVPPVTNPPAPTDGEALSQPEEPPTDAPVDPAVEATTEPASSGDPSSELPTYDDIVRRLRGRTNPPTPALAVRPDGSCVVTLRDPRRPQRPPGPDGPIGVRIQCPPGAVPPEASTSTDAAPAPAQSPTPAESPAPAESPTPAGSAAPAAAPTPAPDAG